MSLLLRNGLILTMNDRLDIVEGDLSIRGGRIAAIGPNVSGHHDRTIDAGGGYVLPGFVQTHIHLCQTLFRGYADDLRLMDWLRTRVWPMEAAHTPATLRAAARLATTELLCSGTTSVLTMETVHDTDAVFEAVVQSGIRATIGKCMMDFDAEVPARLRESTASSIDESLAIRRRWHNTANGRLRAAFAPRFAVSCSRELLEAVAALSGEHDALVHTHASESKDEQVIVRERSGGLTNIQYLDRLHLASPRLCVAHCVWVDDHDQATLAEREAKVLHCPGSNLKLGSGIAPVVEMRARGITVSLGADGAACNNRLDMFEEMRLAGVLQAMRERGITVSLGADGAACNNRLDMFDEMRLAATLQAMRRGPGALPARDVLWMATRSGAKTLGLEQEIGSLEPGKRADVIIVERDRPHLSPGPDPYSTLVYAARGSDVRTTIVDGDVLVNEFMPARVDRREVSAQAREAAHQLFTSIA